MYTLIKIMHYLPIVHTSIPINFDTFRHLQKNEISITLFLYQPQNQHPDPFIMITGILFFSAVDIWMMVLISPPQTRITIGTGIPVKENLI